MNIVGKTNINLLKNLFITQYLIYHHSVDPSSSPSQSTASMQTPVISTLPITGAKKLDAKAIVPQASVLKHGPPPLQTSISLISKLFLKINILINSSNL